MGSKGEKSNFNETCRLLSQYLKEKGGLGGLGLEMTPKALDQQGKGEIFLALHLEKPFCFFALFVSSTCSSVLLFEQVIDVDLLLIFLFLSGKSRAPATMSLLPGVDVPGEDQTSPKSMDLFPHKSGLDSGALAMEEPGNKTSDIK